MPADKVLVVEDSKAIHMTLKPALERACGVEVLVAETYDEAVAAMDALGGELFLAILDLALPDAMHGEVVDCAASRRIPSIVFSSTFDPKTRERILSKGVIDYVIKNNRAIEELVRIVGRLQRNRGVRVLVVDDSPVARAVLHSMLAPNMFQVSEAASGQEALEVIARDKDCCLVLTDYEMPGMNGLELTSLLRRTMGKDELAIVGVSSIEDESLTAQFLKSGASDFMKKPCGREEFLSRVIKNIETVEHIRRMAELNDLKDKFLGMAAHDLRNPINAISVFSRMLLDGLAEGRLRPKQEEMVELIHAAGTQMRDLVNDLLDISVIESGKLDLALTPFRLDELVAERMRIAALVAGKKAISLDRRLAPVDIMADPKRLAQVLDNLLSNALKFSPPGATVSVALVMAPHEAILSVADQGPGIREEEKAKLFHSFQKLSARPTGNEPSTGLGLAIVKKIVQAHRGRVWVQSEPGQGAVFHVALPLA